MRGQKIGSGNRNEVATNRFIRLKFSIAKYIHIIQRI